MPIEFGSTKSAHLIPKFRAFVHDNGMPGVRFEREDGEYADFVFSVPGIEELQKQLALALHMATSSSPSKH